MAQVCGGTNFDIVAERRHEAATKAFTGATGLCAKLGIASASIDSIRAVTLRIYLTPWNSWDGDSGINRTFRESRHLEDWMTFVKTPEEEMLNRKLEVNAEQAQTALDHLRMELRIATGQWALGDPEKPAVRDVVNAIEHILWQSRIRVQPPTAKHPQTLQDAKTSP